MQIHMHVHTRADCRYTYKYNYIYLYSIQFIIYIHMHAHLSWKSDGTPQLMLTHLDAAPRNHSWFKFVLTEDGEGFPTTCHPSIHKCCPQCSKYLLSRRLDPKVFEAVGNMKKCENRHFVLRGKKELWLTWLGPAAKRWMFIISSSISLTRELQPRITGSTKLYQQTTDKTISNHVPVLLRD